MCFAFFAESDLVSFSDNAGCGTLTVQLSLSDAMKENPSDCTNGHSKPAIPRVAHSRTNTLSEYGVESDDDDSLPLIESLIARTDSHSHSLDFRLLDLPPGSMLNPSTHDQNPHRDLELLPMQYESFREPQDLMEIYDMNWPKEANMNIDEVGNYRVDDLFVEFDTSSMENRIVQTPQNDADASNDSKAGKESMAWDTGDDSSIGVDAFDGLQDNLRVLDPPVRTDFGQARLDNVQSGSLSRDADDFTKLMQGIESYLDDDNDTGGGVNQSQSKARGKKRKRSKANINQPPDSTRPRSNLLNRLLGNIPEEANANLDQESLPEAEGNDLRHVYKKMRGNIPKGQKNDYVNESKELTAARKILGGKDCRLESDGWSIPGMSAHLRIYQVTGVAFMKRREQGYRRKDDGIEMPLGGLQADGMGTGKTLMTIALMVAHPPARSERRKCTLVVCPSAITKQWEDEIQKHKGPGKLPVVGRHYSGNRYNGTGVERNMEEADIVITTYAEVVRSYPLPEMPKGIESLEQAMAWWNTRSEPWGILHKACFHRVVLDEAHIIKNFRSKTSLACIALKATHRWALSGTPITNKLEELYPIFKFLRMPFTTCESAFRKNFCSSGNNGRLQYLLDEVILRRSYQDKFLGAPIIKLPENSQYVKIVEFSPVEQAIYDLVRKYLIGRLNKVSKEGTTEEQSNVVLRAFHYMRVSTGHIFQAQSLLEEFLELDHLKKIRRKLGPRTSKTKEDYELLAALEHMIAEKKKEAAAKTLDRNLNAPSPAEAGKISQRLAEWIQERKQCDDQRELVERTRCNLCFDLPQDPYVTDCLHVFCHECLNLHAEESPEPRTKCPTCARVFETSEPCVGIKELEMESLDTLKSHQASSKKKKEFDLKWCVPDGRVIMSTKITAVKSQVDCWLNQDLKTKVIVFSQFHMTIEILEHVCRRQKWKYCLYHGKMPRAAREQTVEEFGKDPDMRVMIASLKAGGVGLNLTMASKVISVDLWFNASIEQQAFCRVFRIGQEKTTENVKLIVKGSIDETLEAMQQMKTRIIGGVMNQKGSNLSLADVMKMFGDVHYDDNYKPFIALAEDKKLDVLLSHVSPNGPSTG